MATTAAIAPETVEEFERLSSELHELGERAARIDREVAEHRVKPTNQVGESELLERLKSERAIVTQKIQTILPKWAELKMFLKR